MARLTYSVPEAAKALGISEWLAYRMVKSGEIPSRRYGNRIVIPKAALDAALRSEPEPA